MNLTMRARKKKSKKKGIAATRLLRQLYKTCPNPTIDEMSNVQRQILDSSGELVELNAIRIHFQEMRYRHSRQNGKPVARQKRTKSSDDIHLLQRLFHDTFGVVPRADCPLLCHVLQCTTLTREEIAQWYGQERSKLKKKHRYLNVHNAASTYTLAEDTERPPQLAAYY